MAKRKRAAELMYKETHKQRQEVARALCPVLLCCAAAVPSQPSGVLLCCAAQALAKRREDLRKREEEERANLTPEQLRKKEERDYKKSLKARQPKVKMIR